MVKYTPEEAIELMKNRHNVRNISVIAHVDHGKTTLSDSLLARAGLISDELAGDSRVLDTTTQEQERGITIRSTGVSLCFQVDTETDPVPNANGNLFLVNLVDSPGHIDFSSEVTAALRVTDGALVVVDCVEGVCVQTETVLRQAIAERIRPVLFMNKLDRLIFELQLQPEDAYQKCLATIEAVNDVIRAVDDGSMGDLTLSPERGNVGFGSGYYGWGFTLWQFARRLAAKQQPPGDPRRIMTRLWGDHFYDSENRKFYSSPVSPSGVQLPRFFCQAIFDPIFKLTRSIAAGERDEPTRMLSTVGVALTDADFQEPRQRMKGIMKKFVHVADALVMLIVHHLPSPVVSQRYRVATLYTGPLDDACARSISECDAQAPVLMYVSKMVPTSDARRFYAFGRVFAGTLRTGARVRVLGPNFQPGSQTDEMVGKSISGLVQFMGRGVQRVDEAPCGVTIGVLGLDQALLKCGTVTTSDVAHPIRSMKFSVSPIVRVAVAPKNSIDLPLLVDGLKRLAKIDPCVQVTIGETGELVIAAAGELHLQVCLAQLKEDYFSKETIVSPPVVAFRETVEKSSQPCLAKSPNKHNRLFVSVAPLGAELVNDLTNKVVLPMSDANVRAHYLEDKHGWNLVDAKKIWAFSPLDATPSNVVVDVTKGVQYMGEIKDSVTAAFQWASKEGVLCDEELRGVRVDITDAMLHADAVHRGPGQIIPSARRAIYAAVLSATPRLVEPVYLIEISTTQDSYRALTSVLRKRRGELLSDDNTFAVNAATQGIKMKAYVPVIESFGLEAELRQAAHGRAMSQLVFDHWQEVPGDPLDPRSIAGTYVTAVRARKGLPAGMPNVDQYIDRL